MHIGLTGARVRSNIFRRALLTMDKPMFILKSVNNAALSRTSLENIMNHAVNNGSWNTGREELDRILSGNGGTGVSGADIPHIPQAFIDQRIEADPKFAQAWPNAVEGNAHCMIADTISRMNRAAARAEEKAERAAYRKRIRAEEKAKAKARAEAKARREAEEAKAASKVHPYVRMVERSAAMFDAACDAMSRDRTVETETEYAETVFMYLGAVHDATRYKAWGTASSRKEHVATAKRLKRSIRAARTRVSRAIKARIDESNAALVDEGNRSSVIAY